MREFYLNHKADDILYALKNPEYYRLTIEQETELSGLVFKAINNHQAMLERIDRE